MKTCQKCGAQTTANGICYGGKAKGGWCWTCVKGGS